MWGKGWKRSGRSHWGRQGEATNIRATKEKGDEDDEDDDEDDDDEDDDDDDDDDG